MSRKENDLDRLTRQALAKESAENESKGQEESAYYDDSDYYDDSEDDDFDNAADFANDDEEYRFLHRPSSKSEDEDDDHESLGFKVGCIILAIIAVILLAVVFVGCRDGWIPSLVPTEEPQVSEKNSKEEEGAEDNFVSGNSVSENSVSENSVIESSVSKKPESKSPTTGNKSKPKDSAVTSQKPIKVKVKINSIKTVYGAPLMTLSYEVEGVKKETLSKYIVLTKAPGNNVGEYAITGTCTAPSLYNVEFVSGKYTIIPREVTLQADNKESFVGEALKPLTYTTVSGSIVKGDTVVTLSTSADSKKAGTYDIVGKCINTNYKLTVKVGKYTVKAKGSSSSETKPIDVAVKISDKSSYYGDKIAELDFSVTKGDVKKDDLKNYIKLTKASGDKVGNYDITGKCTDTGKYNVTFTKGTYTIKARKLSVSIDNKESFVGDKLATLTYSVKSGSVVSGDKCIELSTSADPAKAGTYEIVGKCINSNYNATIENKGVYTVKEKEVQAVAVTVQIENKTSTYGDSIVGLDFSVVGGDVTKAEIAPYITLSKEGDNNVGDHKISGTCSDTSKYNVTFKEGTYTITQRSISVKIDDKQTYEGDPLDKLTYTVTSGNEVNGDEAISLTTSAKSESIGEYTIDVSFNPNYDVQIESGGTYRVKAKPQPPKDENEEVENPPSGGPQDNEEVIKPNQPTDSEPEESNEQMQPTSTTL